MLLLDLHSCLQISLGVCTWGIAYERRPAALTTTILCCSITTNAAAGILILLGDRRTRKKDVLERLLKKDLTAEAMRKVRKQKEKEKEAENDDGRVLGIDMPPIVDRIRKSESVSRKDKSDIGKFDTAVPQS